MTMTSNFVSSQYLANALVAPVNQAQSALATATTEMSSGEYENLGQHLGDQSGYELSLKEEVGRITALTASNAIVSTGLATAQNALSSISSQAASTVTSLTSWNSSANTGENLQTIGQSALQLLIASGNATSGGTYVFGGVNSSESPLANYFSTPDSSAKTAVLSAFQSAFGVLPTDAAASSISASAMTTFLSGTFSSLFSGASWSSDWSSASSVNTTAEIAQGQTVTTSADANNASFQQLAQAYTMLSAFGGTSLSASAQQAVASSASSLITEGQSSLVSLQASLGESQSAITEANNAMASQSTLLQTQIGNVDDVDQNAIAAQITGLQTQIQMSYELTSKLQELSLANYLPVS